MKTLSILVVTILCTLQPLFAQDADAPGTAHTASADFIQGEELFMQNKPNEALPYLEKVFMNDQTHVEGALYLAMCYEQLGKLDEAISVYQKILPSAGDKAALIACNLGNVYFRRGSSSSAELSYSQAIRSDPAYASAWLNRANARIKNGALREAIQDYDRYLSLEPASPQRPQIEKLIAMIKEEFAAEEIRRLMAEEAARTESDRLLRLMNEVSASQAETEAKEAAAAEAKETTAEDEKIIVEVKETAGAEDLPGNEDESQLE